jgi:mannosyltransferase
MPEASPSAPGIDVRSRPALRSAWFTDRIRANSLVLDVVVACSVALVLGLIRLGTPSLWLDESFTATGNPIKAFTGGYHWLYYSFVKPWTAVAGTSEWALRFPSVVGSMLACGLLVVLAHRLFGRWVALVSGLLLAASPFFVKWSQQARGYTLLVAASLGATLLLLRALDRGTRGTWAVYGVSFAFVMVWHPVGALLLVPAQLVLIVQQRERAMPHALLAGVIVMALGIPWAAQIALRSTGEGVAMDWLKRPSPGLAARDLLAVSGAAGLGVVLAAVGLWVLHRHGKRDVGVWLGTWAFAPFALALLVSFVRPIYLDRYLIVAAPAFALLGGIAVVGLGTRARALAIAAVVVATGVGLVQWYSTATNGNWRDEDWRGAVATVLARHGDAPILVAPWSASPAATYYGAKVVSTSTASSIWVLSWSETRDTALSKADRVPLGFGGLRLVETEPFGSRLSLQRWQKP